jgi:hypothetical protein
MRRRLALTLVALLGLLAAPSPAGSSPGGGGAPDVHGAGIEPAEAEGGHRATRIPRLVRPGSDHRPDAGAQTGTPARTGGPLAPTTLTVFDGVSDQEVLSPADPTGALGVTHHLAAVNVRMAFYDRLTGAQAFPPKRLKTLDPELPAGADDFDPKVVYDPYRQRFVLAFASATDTQSFLSIVVIPEGSETDTNDWCVLHMSGDQVSANGRQLADYPMVGFTENRVTLTSNQFDYSSAPAVGGFRYVQIVSFRKVDLYDCTVDPVPIEVFSGSQTDDPDGSAAFTIVPGISTGGAPTVQYMASIDYNGVTGKVILWRLRTVHGTLRLGRTQVSKGTMGYPPWGRQCGSTTALNTKWDTGDLRLTSAFWDGDRGRLYTATAIRGNVGGGGDESVVRWWEIDPAVTLSKSRATRKANIAAPGRDAAWPSVATDGDGKLWVNYARAGVAGADECLAAYAAVVQPGATVAASTLYRAGEGRYEFAPGPDRWGDFTAISRDPVDPSAVAVYGAYPIDDGGGATTEIWQQVIATLKDV